MYIIINLSRLIEEDRVSVDSVIFVLTTPATNFLPGFSRFRNFFETDLLESLNDFRIRVLKRRIFLLGNA